ncbi:serine/threonine-protein kinase PBS1 [Vigna unguiculata]|uniref:Receptor-like serine/threonine-protein kinase n=1 Tax=Vigna unguiculata TaxID=3917 RepID=A0A4D6MAP8_VIGUN|nr:serine/threonine-protein kinase PBS1 [Vigna unguiculata]
MAISQTILGFITFTCLMHITKPSNLNTDTLLQGHEFTTSDRLISPTGWYTMSFFQREGSADFYLGIGKSAENSTDQNFWIANRDTPIHDPAPFLTIDEFGNLKIISNRDINSTIMLYSSDAGREVNNNNSTTSTSTTTTFNAILQDTGNLILREMNQNGSLKRILWQSFDHLSHVLMMGMKLGFDRKTGQNWSITSRRSEETYLSGSFTLALEPTTKQLVIWWKGNILWSSGQWSNGNFANLKSQAYQKDFEFDYYSDENETYVSYLASYIYIAPSGSVYGGASGSSFSCFSDYILSGCSMPSVPRCRDYDSLYRGSWNSYGVMSGKGFKFDESENLTNFDCWMKCLNNCSCEAYSYVNDDETGCEIWSRDSANFVATTNLTGGGRQIYFLVPRKNAEDRKKRTKLLSEIGGNTAISIAYNEIKERKKDGKTSDDMYIFDFQTILEVTANFSSTNKIGEGGFGPVYKEKLPSGQEVAIKRLSKSSGQGLVEFKNEAMLIVKLQHTNLVRLLGFCIDREERILVYEYLPNKSLDLYLFGSNHNTTLEWNIRCKIIEGVAQGLVYLHQYSRLKVVHRDLKASNILLDNQLNPKISDFGMARIFGLIESEERTNRIVGTFGYMSPEYAMMGVISTKTDVYSFGILLLEILSGKKNSSDYPFNLAFNAWKLWNEGEALTLTDTNMNGSYSPTQVLRYIHIGLLCTQDQARDRPTMLEVVSFISNENGDLPEPKQPGFCVTGPPEEERYTCSVRETTNSLTSGR